MCLTIKCGFIYLGSFYHPGPVGNQDDSHTELALQCSCMFAGSLHSFLHKDFSLKYSKPVYGVE